ncbi:MAG: thiolase family protein [Verrucomicrobiales bacterium]
MKSNTSINGRLAIIDGVRTPFTKIGTDLASFDATELGRIAVSQLLARTAIDPETIDHTIIGCVSHPPDAANIARVIALRAGVPRSVPAMTVQRNCASGLEALTSAQEKLYAGRGETFIIGGTESMSQVPMLFSRLAASKFAHLGRARSVARRIAALAAFRPADFAPLVGLKLGLTDPVTGMNMGETAEVLAREFQISREEQDGFALLSHQRAAASRKFLDDEICPVFEFESRSPHAVIEDNGIREDQSPEALARLRPAFDREMGTVTAGNASQISDGAVALLVMSERRAEAGGLEPLGFLESYAYTGCDPKRMGLGPVPAIARASQPLNLQPADADVMEINEAFAAQVLAVLRSIDPGNEIDRANLNPNGGAIALGHPVGATGARLVLTALKELNRRQGKRALVSLCVGGGQGAAAWLSKD